MEQKNREEHRSGPVCDLCNEKFKNKSELKEHWEIDHEIRVYECVHLECEEKYIIEEMWREHMKEKHEIGFYCEHCDEYCLFEEQLEEHKESHVVECVYCKEKFESIDKVIEHENEGECDQCGKRLGCGTNLGKHKKREHEITSEEGSKEEENKR